MTALSSLNRPSSHHKESFYCLTSFSITPEQSQYKEYITSTKVCYPNSFLSIIPVKEIWEQSLEAFERLYPSKEDATPTTKFERDRRLIWLVNPSEQYVSCVLEQKYNEKGVWTKGKAVALARIKNGGPDLDFVTEHDKLVMQSVTSQLTSSYSYYKKEEFFFNHQKAFFSLINHPHIEHEETRLPLEFVKGSIELVVKEKDGALALSLSPPCITKTSILHQETETRYRVIEKTAQATTLQNIIGPTNELIVPKTEKKRLQKLMKRIGVQFPVQFDLEESSVKKEGDPSLHVQLSPIGKGLKINLFVRPFGSEGPYYKPGHGFQAPQALIKNKSQTVLRNLSSERDQANHLISSVELLKLYDVGQDEWILEEPEEVLETLSLIHEYPKSLKIVWPGDKKLSVSPPVHTKNLTLRIKTDDNGWFSLDGEIKIDNDRVIELKQLLELIDSSSSRFIAINDTQFIALTDHFKRQLLELKSLSENKKNKLSLHPLASHTISDILQESSNLSVDAAWHETQKKLSNAETHIPKIPETLSAELRQYQIEGFQWLSRLANWGVGACLADDMGLGKTVQAIALMLEHAPKGPIIIVAPTSVCHNWISECSRFAPSLTVLLHASERDSATITTLQPMQVLITSYGLLHQEIELLSSISWQAVFLDEAQVIKNAHTKRSQAAMQLRSPIKVILTGTPLENRLSELWSLFHFINPGLLGSQESFLKRFAEPIELRKDLNAKRALKKLIQPFILRRLKSQVLTELPSRTEKSIIIPFDGEEQAFYEALRQNAVEKLSLLNDKKRIHILAEITKLRRACCHPQLVVPETTVSGTKLQALLELIEELRENKHHALIFSQFIGCLEKVRQLLEEKGISYQYLDGSTPIDERKKRVDAFQSGQGEFFLISLRAGGTGLNLTAADYVIHLDPWWNPAVEDQASDRAHRIGQTRPVTIYRMIMEGSIEEKILKLHDRKRNLAYDLLEDSDQSATLSDDELLALLKP